MADIVIEHGIVNFIRRIIMRTKKIGKLVGVCNCECHCGLKNCFVNHDKLCKHCELWDAWKPMKGGRMNFNTWAASITRREGKKISINNGQTKEILRIILLDMKAMSLIKLFGIIAKVKK